MNPIQQRNRIRFIAAVSTMVVIVGIILILEFIQNENKTSSAASKATSAAVLPATSTQSTSNGSTPSSSASTSSESSSAASTASSGFKDGTYTAQSSYYVPHGSEQIGVTLTVASGVVTDSSIVNSESDRESQRYQEDFASQYKTSVVGQKLSSINLSYVAGASDTTNGFNDAVANIRNQAKV